MSVIEKLVREVATRHLAVVSGRPREVIARKLESEPIEAEYWGGLARREVLGSVLPALGITEAQAAALMDGSAVVVPREATAEMLEAALDAPGDTRPHASIEQKQAAFRECWRRAFAASQHEETKP